MPFPSNLCLASSKQGWAFAKAPYAAGPPLPESGVWSVWPSLSNDCMGCAPTEQRASWLEARKTSEGTYPSAPNAQSLSERVANACPMSRSDPCRIFLSYRLLGPCRRLSRPLTITEAPLPWGRVGRQRVTGLRWYFSVGPSP